jgi:hypothetical protein
MTAARREAAAHLQALLDVSERRACRVVGGGSDGHPLTVAPG